LASLCFLAARKENENEVFCRNISRRASRRACFALLAIRAARRLDEFDFPRFVHRVIGYEHFKSAAAFAALVASARERKNNRRRAFSNPQGRAFYGIRRLRALSRTRLFRLIARGLKKPLAPRRASSHHTLFALRRISSKLRAHAHGFHLR